MGSPLVLAQPKFKQIMKKSILLGLCLLCIVASFAQSTSKKTDDQKWKVRLRGILVMPPSSSYDVDANTKITASKAFVPELDFTYYFSKNLAAELILGTTRHTIKQEEGSAKVELGKVMLLPPTLNLQYHFPLQGVEPYIGAGINYTIFYGAKKTAVDLVYKNKVGFSTQAGCDFNVSDKWFINVDIKKLFLKTDVTIKGSESDPLKGVKIDPFIIGVGIGTRF